MPPKFVPRQRKHKVLARQKTNGVEQANGDSNVAEILPFQQHELDKKKAQLKQELKGDSKVSSKKAKRLEKYIENKLKKDENRELIARLAEKRIDTSLFSSSRSLGQGKETKREALSRALREQNAGLVSDRGNELLYEARGASPEAEDDGDLSDISAEVRLPPTTDTKAPDSLTPGPPSAAGSGLKRPLDVDDEGKPVLRKRQKRGGIRSKLSSQPSEDVGNSSPADDEWNGFSSDVHAHSDSEQLQKTHSETSELDDDDHSSEIAGDKSSSSDGVASSDGSESEGEVEAGPERSSAFKAWAHQQRNDALGYKPTQQAAAILDIPKPQSFVPRLVEQDPLPFELRQTANPEREVYSVNVTRSPEIQDARLRLPITAEEQKIMEIIHNYNVVVIRGATGSGKTTQVPQFLFEAGYGSQDSPTPGMIGITQPRRVAAVSMSKRVSKELGDYSDSVAYQIRFEGIAGPKTAIKFMTDGILLREVAQDIALRKYSAIVVDEAHERSMNTDILIGMLSRIVKLRADMAKEDTSIKPLKLIIMSATLRIADITENSTLFPMPPPVLDVEGRQFPVTIHFARKTHRDYVEEAFRKVSKGHRKLPPGAILVFLTGKDEISQLQTRLEKAFKGVSSAPGPKVRIPASEAPLEPDDIELGDPLDMDDGSMNDGSASGNDDDDDGDDDDDDDADFEVGLDEEGPGPSRMRILPLHSSLPTKEQQKVFEPPPDGHRMIILATNVAETSLTIPGVRYVFDCGRSKERRIGPRSGVQRYEVGWISKASANQRSGRAGRTGPGHCYRLYSSAVYERDFPEFAEPEVLRTPLEDVALQLKAMNLQHVANFPFPTPPERHSLLKAEKLLTYLSAIDSEGKVTQIGSTMSIFPLAPRFARILLIGHLHDCLPYTIALVAGLSVPEIFLPENLAIGSLAAKTDDAIRNVEDVMAEDRQANERRKYNAVHKGFCSLDDKSDAIKLLQVVGEYAHEPTEEWCKNHFVNYKALKETQAIRRQIKDLLRAHVPAFANLHVKDKLDAPSAKQVSALKQMVASGFVDQVAIRADMSPTPPDLYQKPRRAIEVPYVPLTPLESDDKLVYIHPRSPLAHLSTKECPEYIVYAQLQKAATLGVEGEKRPKTRMHALTDITGSQLASLAKGTPLISYGKPIKEIKGGGDTEGGKVRECWVVPYLRAEGTGGMGWPLPARKVKQRKVAGKGWVVE